MFRTGLPSEAEKQAEAQFKVACELGTQGKMRESAASYRDLLQRLPTGHPSVPAIQYNLAWHELAEGNLELGFRYRIEGGRALKIIIQGERRFQKPKLETSTDLRGKTVLMNSECGAGDEILAARYGKMLKARGAARTIWMGSHGLESVLSRVDGIDQTIPYSQLANVDFDYWVLTLELPLLLKPTADDIGVAPYLSPRQEFADKWRSKIVSQDRLKVGIRWAGKPHGDTIQKRSVPFALLDKLTDLPGVDVYSLQKDEGAHERPNDSRVIDWGSELETWEDTLGALSQLDLVISSCTAIPHLSAALGVETWVFCRPYCYYPWAFTQDRISGWYPSAQVFREEILGNWGGPLCEAKLELLNRLKQPELSPKMRIDCQGSEPRALAELKDRLKAEKPAIALRFSPGLILRQGGSPFEIFAFIEKNAYIPCRAFTDKRRREHLIPVGIDALLNFTRDYRGTEEGLDLLLIHAAQFAGTRSKEML